MTNQNQYHRTPAILWYEPPRQMRAVSIAGLLVGLGFAVLSNVLTYVATYGDSATDGYELIGFPMVFYRRGGFRGVEEFSIWMLSIDVVFVFILGLTGAVIGRRIPWTPWRQAAFGKMSVLASCVAFWTAICAASLAWRRNSDAAFGLACLTFLGCAAGLPLALGSMFEQTRDARWSGTGLVMGVIALLMGIGAMIT